MTRHRRSAAAGFCRTFVGLLSLLVPARARRSWRREWEAEIAFANRSASSYDEGGDLSSASGRKRETWRLLRRTSGAPLDVLSLLREEWSPDMLVHDLRMALRALALRPGFTAIAVSTLAAGIGAATTIFSVVDGVLLAPLPYHAPGDLVRIFGTDSLDASSRGNLNPLDVRDWREQSIELTDIASINTGTITLTGSDEPLRLRNGLGSANLFEVLGVRPLLGRTFATGEDEIGRHRVAVLGYSLWRQQFGADPDVVGTTITLAGNEYDVIGVLGPEFIDPIGAPGDPPPDLWRPLAVSWDEVGRGGHFMYAVGRLADDAGLQRAQAEMDALAAATAAEFPAAAKGRGATLVPLRESMLGDARPALVLASGSVVFVLLIACGNVANLVLARGIGRRREMSIRAALGAARARLVRQLLTESTIVALIAGLLGTLLAGFAIAVVATTDAGNLPRLDRVELDASAVLFATLVSLMTAVLFGLLPAVLSSAAGPAGSVGGGSRASASHVDNRLRGGLVVVEVALSVVLLAGAALMVQSVWALVSVDPGFDPERLLTARLSLAGEPYATDAERIAFHQRLDTELAGLPGVTAVGGVNMLPFSGSYSCDSFGLEDRPAPPEGEEPCAETRVVDGGYFTAMRLPLVAGRVFTASDTADVNPVVVINQTMAETYWPGRDPLGQRFRYGSRDSESEPWRTIVGVVGNVRHFGYREQAYPEVYFPYADWPVSSLYRVIRVDGEPLELAAAVRGIVRAIDDKLPVYAVGTMAQMMADTVAAETLGARLLAAFAIVALLLATLGLYGVVSYNVSLRHHEIGVRMALGARGSDVLALVARRGTALAAVGVMLGLVAAAGLTRLFESLLFGVSPTDTVTLALVAAVLLGVAIVACLVPARRAARVDPLVALRHR